MTNPAIEVRTLTEDEITTIGCRSWPIWTKEISEFPWSYDEREACLILEGDVEVVPDGGGKPVRFGAGDYVVFPRGLACRWKIRKAVRKHYNFG